MSLSQTAEKDQSPRRRRHPGTRIPPLGRYAILRAAVQVRLMPAYRRQLLPAWPPAHQAADAAALS
jgi:hypothetical protein